MIIRHSAAAHIAAAVYADDVQVTNRIDCDQDKTSFGTKMTNVCMESFGSKSR